MTNVDIYLDDELDKYLRAVQIDLDNSIGKFMELMGWRNES